MRELWPIAVCLILGYTLGLRFQSYSLRAVEDYEQALAAFQASEVALLELQSQMELAAASREVVLRQIKDLTKFIFPTDESARQNISANQRPLTTAEAEYTREFPCLHEQQRDRNETNETKPQDASSLPVYVFVAGIEGAGHHALETVWSELGQYYNVVATGFNPGLHSFAKRPDVHKAYQFSSTDLEVHRETFRKFLSKPQNSGSTLIIDSRNSFPMGGHVGNVAHPDLIYLSKLDGVLFDLRVLFIYRDPTAAALSSVRRFSAQCPYKNYQFQARSAQEALIVMNNAIPSLPCGKFMYMRYENFTKTPMIYNEELAKLLSVDPSVLTACYSQLKPSQAHKEDTASVALQRQDMTRFFAEQEGQWPLLTGKYPFPPLRISRPLLSHLDVPRIEDIAVEALAKQRNKGKATGSSNSKPDPAEQLPPLQPVAINKDRYLKLDWYNHLGFNNVRFILEIGLAMSTLSNRQLVLPTHLRMRKCLHNSLCNRANCQERKTGEFWCPFSYFLNSQKLAEIGAVDISNTGLGTDLGLPQRSVPAFFDSVYSPDSLWVDRIPSHLTSKSTGNHTFASSASFRYWDFRLGCELTRVLFEQHQWDGRQKAKSVFSFAEELARYTSDPIVKLEGAPHHIGMTPYVWTNPAAIEQVQRIWERHVVYNDEIVAYAGEAVAFMKKKSKGGKSFVSVHMRRGDFAELGWLGDAADLNVVRDHIRSHLHGGETVYIATDESDPAVLNLFRGIGAVFWSDLRDALEVSEEAYPTLTNMMSFEDYVGLIEQMICSQGRVFFGSKCSSFTGGILNLRKVALGDTTYNTLTKNNMWS